MPKIIVILKDRKMAIPPKRGTGLLWTFLSDGKSKILAQLAKDRIRGVKIRENPTAAKNRKKRSIINQNPEAIREYLRKCPVPNPVIIYHAFILYSSQNIIYWETENYAKIIIEFDKRFNAKSFVGTPSIRILSLLLYNINLSRAYNNKIQIIAISPSF